MNPTMHVQDLVNQIASVPDSTITDLANISDEDLDLFRHTLEGLVTLLTDDRFDRIPSDAVNSTWSNAAILLDALLHRVHEIRSGSQPSEYSPSYEVKELFHQ